MYAYKVTGEWVEYTRQALPIAGLADGLYQVPSNWSDAEKEQRFGVLLVVDDPVPDGKVATSWALAERNGRPVRVPTLVDAPVVNLPALDQQTLNSALTEPGSVVRALGLIMFEEINKLRVKTGLAQYTMQNFIDALVAHMR